MAPAQELRRMTRTKNKQNERKRNRMKGRSRKKEINSNRVSKSITENERNSRYKIQ